VYLYDVSGRRVRKLMDEASLAAGLHEVATDGRDAAGRRLSSGIYFYRVETAEGSSSGRFAVLD
jgi:flagellar hook assembly protein FlgD